MFGHNSSFSGMELNRCLTTHDLDQVSAVIDVPNASFENRYDGLTQTEQVEKLASYLNGKNEIKYENWEKLSLQERVDVLQDIENKAAALGERCPLQVEAVDLGDPSTGIFTAGQMVWHEGKILINRDLLGMDSMESLSMSTDTLLHEGRHAYQWSNMLVKRTEPNNEKFGSWKMNILETGYLDCNRFGFQMYSMQPVELDARVFAEEVRSKISFR